MLNGFRKVLYGFVFATMFACLGVDADIVINEIMYRATGGGAAGNNEFIELYNTGPNTIDLTTLRLIDGNLITGDLDGTNGSITGSTSPFDFTCVGVQICLGSTSLAPDEYAVVWVGSQNLTTKNASEATFQAWLGQGSKLRNTADDVWLFDSSNGFIDYVAWGNPNSNSVNTDYPPGAWNDVVQISLSGVSAGASISLTPNGIDSNDSQCWEPSTSGEANGRCAAYVPTVDSDLIGARVTSLGRNNNPSADLSITKDDGTLTYTPGAGFVYTLTVNNNGPDAANGAIVSDTLPSWAEGVTWTCTATGATCPNLSGSGNILSELIANFPNGGELVYQISGTYSSDMSQY